MKGGQPPMRPRVPWFVIALVGGALGCGGSSVAGGASSKATYAGVVLAMVTEAEGSSDYVARALFTTGPRPVIGGCPQCCCGSTNRGLPIPRKPPDAGPITIAAADSTSLATLVPAPFENGSGHFYGMTDLGWSWLAPLGDYAPAASQPWGFGDTLQVLAVGNEVDSFSGSLRSGPSLTGVTPPIGPSTVAVDHTEPFEISWTPAGDADATMLLGIPTGTGLCFCDAPDSAGRLVVDANLLSPVSSEITLARLSVSTVTSGNATLDLVGAVVQKGPVQVR